MASNEWWDQVTVTPDDRRTTVFSKGTPQGERGLIPVGGQIFPISIVGANLLWKNLQKKAKKKQTSDKIKKIIPIRRPRVVINLWNPCIVLSRVTSRHHWYIVIVIINNPISISLIDCVWNHTAVPLVMNKAPKDPVKDHGLISTKWKGLIVKLDIFINKSGNHN